MKQRRWMVLLLLCGVLLTACGHAEEPPLTDPAGNTTVGTTVSADVRTQQLEFYLNGETVRLSFASESVEDGQAEYRYVGALSAGTAVECTVIPSKNRIHEIVCDVTSNVEDDLKKAEAGTFLSEELTRMGFACSEADLANLIIVMDKRWVPQLPPYASARLSLSEREFLSVYAVRSNGIWYIQRITARSNVSETAALTEYEHPYLIPNWVNG